MDPCSPRAPARNSLPPPPAQYRPLLPHGPAEDLLPSNSGANTLIPPTLRPNFWAKASGGAALAKRLWIEVKREKNIDFFFLILLLIMKQIKGKRNKVIKTKLTEQNKADNKTRSANCDFKITVARP